MLKGSTCDSRNGVWNDRRRDRNTRDPTDNGMCPSPRSPRSRRFLFQFPSWTRVKVGKLLPCLLRHEVRTAFEPDPKRSALVFTGIATLKRGKCLGDKEMRAFNFLFFFFFSY